MPTLNTLNARTLANVIAGSTDAQETLWMVNIHRQSRGMSPITSWFGGLGGGHPIAEVMDTRKVRGQEIVASVSAGLGQRGVFGDSERLSKSEKYKHKDYRVKIGMGFHSVAQSRVASNMTVIGSDFDKKAGPDLAEWVACRKWMDVEAEMFKRAHSRNTLRPNNKASTNDLVSADVFGISSVIDVRDGMLGLNAAPLAVAKGADNSVVEKYYIQGHQYLFSDLNRNSTWINLRAQAENRGPGNTIFAGGKPMYEGCIINEWMIKMNDFDATQGARCMPIAVVGVAIPAAVDTGTAASTYIYGGGGAAAAANTEVDYFQNFLNAPYGGFEVLADGTGGKIAADTTTERYLAVKLGSGSDKGKFRLFAYKVNDGNKITITRSVGATNVGGTSLVVTALSATSGAAAWNTGAWTTDFITAAEVPVGSLVYQCNIKGQTFCYGYGVADRMMLCGYGSVDGATAFGRRITDEQDFKRNVGIGMELVWGCRATQDTNDVVNGYIIFEAAFNPAGLPDIT